MRIFIFSFLLVFKLFPQINILNQPVAESKFFSISVEEFYDRFHFSSHLTGERVSLDSLKKSFLYSLIAEKLWAQRAKQELLDTNEIFRLSLSTLRKLLVKDNLYYENIEKKIFIDEDKIADALFKFSFTINIKLLAINNFDEASQINLALKNGANFDSILYLRPEYNQQKEGFWVTYGNFDSQVLEDSVFNTSPNQISAPVKTENGYIIFKVLAKVNNPEFSDDPEIVRNKVVYLITNRERKQLEKKYKSSLFPDLKIVINEEVVKSFINKIRSFYLSKEITFPYVCNENDFIEIFNSISSEMLNSDLTNYELNEMKLKDFIFFLIYEKPKFESFDIEIVTKKINSHLMSMITQELLYTEGVNQGLDKSGDVLKTLKIWEDYYLSHSMLQSIYNKVADSVNSSAKLAVLEQIELSRIYVDIAEIFVEDISLIEKVLNQIDLGIDFIEIAGTMNENKRPHRTGFFDPYAAGLRGEIALKMEVGEMYGPFEVDGGYSLIKLIDRKENDSLSINTVLQAENEIKLRKNKLRLQIFEEYVTNETANMAMNEGVEIYKEIFEKVQFSEISTFTIRRIGFGGKIAAFPITVPNFIWIRKLSDSVLP
ncbi:MAG: hypothetical protein IAE91_03465 [Ignavibacteriaceae bacterium]|nr:hypothetical protein [Ignavibacteriaceae bacterium]